MEGFRKELVPNPRPAAHGCNVCRLEDDKLWLMWFAGTREGVEDQRILMTLGSHGGWSPAQVLVDHVESRGERWVPEVGAPIAAGGLWVAFSASPISSFGYRTERDAYLRDLKKARLFVAEVEDWRARDAREISDRDGLILQGKSLPWGESWLLQCNTYDSRGRHSATLMAGSPDGAWRQVRELTCDPGCLEPSTARFSDGQVLCYARYAGNDGCIWRSESGGQLSELSEPFQTTLRNPHSGIDIAVGPDDRMFVAFNDSHRLRTPLTLGISEDRGATWRCRDVETEDGEYSYPKLIRTGDGLWHVFYTWRRKAIAHVEFDPQWLAEGRPVFGLDPGGESR